VSREPRFLADEDFNRDIVTGVLRRLPVFDVLRVQDAGLSGGGDPEILEWAASNERILLTHDTRTMIAYAKARVVTGKPMPGVIVVRQETPIGVAIEELTVIALCSAASEWERQIRFVPL
jgi:predicted nuclease of predicted toxin-antitoxin system